MKNIIKAWRGIPLMCLLSFSGHALYPKSCEPLALKTSIIIPNAKDILWVKNTSQDNIWLTHPVKNASLSAGWASLIEAGNKSAFIPSKHKFKLICTESKPGHEQVVACKNVVDACIWHDAKIPSTMQGGFWLSENTSSVKIIQEIAKRGIAIPSSTSKKSKSQ